MRDVVLETLEIGSERHYGKQGRSSALSKTVGSRQVTCTYFKLGAMVGSFGWPFHIQNGLEVISR